MERRAGDLMFGKTLVFSKFQMAGKSNFTNISLYRVIGILTDFQILKHCLAWPKLWQSGLIEPRDGVSEDPPG